MYGRFQKQPCIFCYLVANLGNKVTVQITRRVAEVVRDRRTMTIDRVRRHRLQQLLLSTPNGEQFITLRLRALRRPASAVCLLHVDASPPLSRRSVVGFGQFTRSTNIVVDYCPLYRELRFSFRCCNCTWPAARRPTYLFSFF